MTSNQIEYLKSRETERHNRETEDIERGKTAETHRNNVIVARENAQHNRATEATANFGNAINLDHLLRMDAETNRSNVARETENTRSNKANESIGETNALGTLMRGQAARDTAYYNLQKLPFETNKMQEEAKSSSWNRKIQTANTVISGFSALTGAANSGINSVNNTVKTATGVLNILGGF